MTTKVTLTIDGRPVKAAAGEKLLFAALDNGIYIPHLCASREEERADAGCRLCFVEIEGHLRPVTSCSRTVEQDMVVRTRSERIDRLVKTAFELLLSDHNLKCGKCPANHNCALQEIAAKRGLKLSRKRFKPLDRELFLDDSPKEFSFDHSRCVLCGQCVRADREQARVGAIGFAGRGIERRVAAFKDQPLAESICTQCLLCVEACPVGALYYKKDKRE